MKRSWIYIIKCADGSYYVGCTTNLEKRIAEHNAGTFEGYTAARRPVRLLWSQECSDIRYAIEAERKLKKWTRAKKEALMRGDFVMLHELSLSTRTKLKLNDLKRLSDRPVPVDGTRSSFDSSTNNRRTRSSFDSSTNNRRTRSG